MAPTKYRGLYFILGHDLFLKKHDSETAFFARSGNKVLGTIPEYYLSNFDVFNNHYLVIETHSTGVNSLHLHDL